MPKHLSTKRLDRILQELLSSLLVDGLGFTFLRGVYYRELPSGLRNVLIIDFRPARRQFIAILGLNSRIIAGDLPANEAGVCLARYLSPGGVKIVSVGYPAFDDRSATASVERLREALVAHGLAWFDSYQTLSSFAEALGDEYDFFKGKLLLADGRPTDAVQWLRRYEQRLLSMPDDPEVRVALAETRDMIARSSTS